VKFVLFILVVLLALIAVFAVQNPGVITVHFLSLSGDTSLLIVIVVAFGVGALAGALASLPAHFRKKSEVAAAKRRVRELENEVAALAGKAAVPKPTETPPAAKPDGTPGTGAG
jgi:uncharacterized membrane protein YciS (DUF1049 family)